MQKEKIKVYTYTRVSTAMQVDGYSLDAQKAKMLSLIHISFQKAVDDLRIGFSGVQIPRCLHRQAQFFNIKICPVRRVDFPSRKSVETSNAFAMRSKCSVLILSVLPLTNRLMALSVLPMREMCIRDRL